VPSQQLCSTDEPLHQERHWNPQQLWGAKYAEFRLTVAKRSRSISGIESIEVPESIINPCLRLWAVPPRPRMCPSLICEKEASEDAGKSFG
jgi:hypothetical protein